MLHEIIQVSTQEFTWNDGFQARKDMVLCPKIANVSPYDQDECFQLYLRQVIIHWVCPNQFCHAVEKSVEEFAVSVWCILEQFKNLIQKSFQKSLERG